MEKERVVDSMYLAMNAGWSQFLLIAYIKNTKP
jgi:hypothetical protein